LRLRRAPMGYLHKSRKSVNWALSRIEPISQSAVLTADCRNETKYLTL
jgi:hypothetical protein